MILLTLVSTFLFVFFLFVWFTEWISENGTVPDKRLKQFLQFEDKMQRPAASLEKNNRLSDLPFLNRILTEIRFIRSFKIWLQQSDIPWSAGSFLLLTAVMAGLPPIWFMLTGTGSTMLSIIFALTCGSCPFFAVQHKRLKRQKAFETAFPDAVGRLASSLRAGYSLQIAIEGLVKELENIVGEEFKHVVGQMEMGQSFEIALQKMLERIDTPDLRLFIASISIQRESGGNLSGLLSNLENTIRERFQLRRELQAASAQGRLSGMVMSLLPVFVAFFVYLIHNEYIMFFFEDPLGKNMLWGALAGQMIGMLCIRKIVRIEM